MHQLGAYRFRIEGVGTTLEFLRFALTHLEFAAGCINTQLVEKMVAAMTESEHQRASA